MVSSYRCHSTVGKGAEHDRTKRSRCSSGAGRSTARGSSAAWMVGTAVYQVAPWVATSAQNVDGRNLGTITVPPVDNVASTAATRPWTWNSGITHIVASSALSS
jgi:hypothetical protein